MAYEYEHDIENALIDSPAHLEDGTFDELKEVYQKARLLDNIVITTKKRLSDQERKAKAFDKVRSFITERLNEEKTTDEYDYGERFMCEEIKRLLEDEVDED